MSAQDARAIQLRAVAWAGNLPGLFPWLRFDRTHIVRFAEEAAAELGPNDGDVPREQIEQGLKLLTAGERRRLVDRFVDRQAAEWRAVRSDVGDLPSLEWALAAGALRTAMLERRLPPTMRLDHLERGLAPARSPQDVLAVTLPPEAVWSVIDLQEAQRAAARARTEEEWLGAITTVAATRSHEAHPLRVQALSSSIRRRLPAEGFPTASAMLDDAYERAESTIGFAEIVALALLPIYVAQLSSYVASPN